MARQNGAEKDSSANGGQSRPSASSAVSNKKEQGTVINSTSKSTTRNTVAAAAPLIGVMLAVLAASSLLLLHDGAVPSDVIRIAVAFAALVAFQTAASALSLERETKRRLQHALTGYGLVVASDFFPLPVRVGGMLFGAAGIWFLAVFYRATFLQFFGELLRPTEIQQGGVLPGAFYFLLGTGLVWGLFRKDVANYALLCLSLADPIAALVGQAIRSPKLTPSASVAGSAACFATAWMVGYLLLRPNYSLWSISRGALFCTIAEAAAFSTGINDNFSIPIVTAFAIEGISY